MNRKPATASSTPNVRFSKRVGLSAGASCRSSRGSSVPVLAIEPSHCKAHARHTYMREGNRFLFRAVGTDERREKIVLLGVLVDVEAELQARRRALVAV